MEADPLFRAQLDVCRKYEVMPFPAVAGETVGISLDVRRGAWPLNALRHPREGTASGWFVWTGGEPSEAADYFQPLHVEHISDWCPILLPYLLLPPGWRVQVAPNYEDVWQDSKLLDI